MIDVTVKVPEGRVGEFYELVGHWLSGRHPEGDVPAATRKDWTNSDEDVLLADMVWQKFNPLARAVLGRLFDHPDKENKVQANELAAAFNITYGKSGVAGVLAWPGRFCAKVNRGTPWRWEPGHDGGGAYYWVERDVAELFNKVRK
jgi:hypothetical protein